MKYILRLLWLIGYIPIFVLELIVLILSFIIFLILVAYFFVKTGDIESTPVLLVGPIKWIDRKYRNLLNKIEK